MVKFIQTYRFCTFRQRYQLSRRNYVELMFVHFSSSELEFHYKRSVCGLWPSWLLRVYAVKHMVWQPIFPIPVGKRFFCPTSRRMTRYRLVFGKWSNSSKHIVFALFDSFTFMLLTHLCPSPGVNSCSNQLSPSKRIRNWETQVC